MKILVTGGCGFIGSNFIHYWLARHPNDYLVNFDKLTYAANPESLADLTSNSHYQFIKADICDEVAVDAVLADGIELIIHFAAESHVDRSIDDPLLFVKTNVLGTYTLLNSAKKHGGLRFHHVSTDEVFGALSLDTEEKFTENTHYDPRSPYSASKASSDHFVRSFFHTFNLPITVSNCSNNYGAFQSPEKFIPRMITNIMDGKKIPVYGDGLYVRDWLYVDDHCSAIEAIVLKGKIGQSYNIGALVKDYSNLEVAKTILRIMNKTETELEFVADRPGHDRRYTVSWEKIKNELGWSPSLNFEEGIQRTIHWYQENEAWWRDSKTEAEAFYVRLNASKNK